MPKKIMAVLLSVLVIVTAFALPSFAAEVPDLAVEEAPVQYATNLVPFPYRSGANVFEPGYTFYKMGLTFTLQADGGIRVSGTSTGGVTFAISNPMTLRPGTYTISGYSEGTDALDPVGLIVRKQTADGVDKPWIGQGYSTYSTGTLSQDESVYYIAVYVAPGKTVDGVVYPMFNMGDFAAPYMLYLPYLLEQQYKDGYANGEAAGNQSGYDQGYTEGESAGYDQGYTDGESFGYDQGYVAGESSGLIQGAEEGFKEGYQAGLDASAQSMNPFAMPFTIKVVPETRYFVDGVTYYYEESFDLNSTFVNYYDYTLNLSWMVTNARNYVYNQIIAKSPAATSITHLDYSFKLVWERSAENQGCFYFDDYSVFSFSSVVKGLPKDMVLAGYVDNTWDGFTIYASSNYHYFLPSDIDLNSFSCLTVAFTVYSSFVEDSIYLCADSSVLSPSYMSGYNQGFFDGAKDGLGQQADLYFDQGYNQGFKEGKKEGLELSNTGDWRHLMLAVTEAPINTFQSLFNFEILGMDMRAAFGSILAVCVVLLIVKKVIF